MIDERFKDELTFLDLRSELKNYSVQDFQADFRASLIVALIAVPQAMAYALVAGLPISCGLLAAILTTVVAGLLGSSRHLVIGPNNALSILISFGMSEVISRHYHWLDGAGIQAMTVQLLTQMTLMVGLFQLMAGFFKLGRLVRFVSYSVITGYIAGASVAVAVSQLFTLLGLEKGKALPSTFYQLSYLFYHMQATHLPSLSLGVLCLLSLLYLRKTPICHASALIMVVGAAAFVCVARNYPEASFLSPFATVSVVRDVGDAGIAPLLFTVPFFNVEIINSMIPATFALALLGMLEVTSIAKSIAVKSGQRISINQDVLAIGIGNSVAAFVGAMPSSSSLSRTVLNYESGGRTRFSAVLNGLIVGAILYFFGQYVVMIPLPALAALLLYIAFNMVDRELFKMCLKTTRADAFVLIATSLSCFFLSLDIAFYSGIFLSITLYLTKASNPNLNRYTVPEKELYYRDLELAKEKGKMKKVRVVEVEGELFFGAADLFQTTLTALAEDDEDAGVIILNLSGARDLDATACLALKRLDHYMAKCGCILLLSGIREPEWDVLCYSGLVEKIGKERIFTHCDVNPHISLHRSVRKAANLLAEGKRVDR